MKGSAVRIRASALRLRLVRLIPLSVAAIGAVFLATFASGGTAASTQPFVPSGSYLAATESGRLLVLSPHGTLLRLLKRGPRVGDVLGLGEVWNLALSPDRRSVYVAVAMDEQLPRLYEVALGSGEKTLIGNAISPALSPDGTELAYLTVATEGPVENQEITALVIRNLQSGSTRTIPFPPGVAIGTPPELIINWSPDGRSIVLFDGSKARIVDVASAQTVESQPALRGNAAGLSPVYLDSQRLVVLPYCCQGPQPLVTVKLSSGTYTPFATAGSPIENVRRLNSRTLLATTALHRLVRITQGHKARALTKTKIVAVTP
jgi:hypothetical protein